MKINEIIKLWNEIEVGKNEEALESLYHWANAKCSNGDIYTCKQGKTDGYLKRNGTTLTLTEVKCRTCGKDSEGNRKKILCQMLAYLVNDYGNGVIPFRKLGIQTDCYVAYINLEDIELLYENFKVLYQKIKGKKVINSKGRQVSISPSTIYNKNICPEIVNLFSGNIDYLFTIYYLDEEYDEFLNKLIA